MRSSLFRPRARLAVEALEDRCQPATFAAPDLLSQYDSGVSSFDNLTRFTQPIFAGTTTSSTNTHVSLVIDDVVITTFTVKRTGGSSFTLAPPAPLVDGSHVARFYDSQTQALSTARNFTIDTTAPNAPPAPTLVSKDDPANILLQIRGVAGDRLHLKINGQETLVVTATGSPQTVTVNAVALGLDLNAPLVATVVDEDSAGNLSAASSGLSVTLQTDPTPPPAPPSTWRLAAASDTGPYNDDHITSTDTPSFTGTAAAGQTVQLFIDGAPASSQLVGVDGTFTLTAGPLGEGAHQATVAAAWGTGALGAASAPIAFTIDKTAPVVSGVAIDPPDLSPNNDGVHDSGVFRFTLSEPAYVAVYFLDSDNFNLGTIPLDRLDAGLQEFDFDIPEFTEGTYTAVVLASDDADNYGDYGQASFAVDLTPPPAPTIALAGENGAASLIKLTAPQFTGVSEPGTTVELRAGETLLGATTADDDGTWTLGTTLAEGDHSLTVTARDKAGNIATSPPRSLTIDTTPPVVASGDDKTVTQGRPVTLTANVSDAHPGTDETWSLINSSNGQSVPSVTGSSLTFTPTQSGVYVFRHAAADAAGNVGDDDVVITVQSAPDDEIDQAPSITNPSASAPSIAEDTTDPAGITIAALAQLLGIVDTPGSLAGVAITSADASHGLWQYALDGTTWSPLGTVAEDRARLLAADQLTRIRFVPSTDWNGTANLVARAWDQSDQRGNGTQSNVAPEGTSISTQTATLAFAVTPVNDAPVLTLPSALAVYRNTDKTIGAAFSVADIDATRLRVSLTIDEGIIVIPSTQGLNFATGNGTPNLTIDGPIDALNARLAALIYRPTRGYLGPVNIAVSVNDLGGTGAGGARVATGTLAFTVVNRPPQIINNPAFSMSANSTLNVSAPGLASAFTDLDGDAFTISLASPSPVGTMVVNPDGSFRYTPPLGFLGTVSFAVAASDGVDSSESLWVTIQIKSAYALRR